MTTTTDPSAGLAPERLVATRDEIAAAFDEWQRLYQEYPGQFASDPGSTYGEDCADYLIYLVTEATS